MALINCFWSYSHADEENDHRIITLFEDVCKKFGAITGEEVGSYFVDKQSIDWGEEWKTKIVDNINNLPFFIPILTPRYFKRPECIAELKTFMRKAEQQQSSELLLPILFIDVPEFQDSNCSDDLINQLKKIHYENWTDLRFEERDSTKYRRAVHSLASKLKKKNKSLEHKITRITVAPIDDGEPGFIDIWSDFENELAEFGPKLVRANDLMNKISGVTNDHTEILRTLTAQGKTPAVKALAIKSLSEKITEPVDEFYEATREYTNLVFSLDKKFPLLVDYLINFGDSTNDGGHSVTSMKESIKELAENMNSSNTSVEQTIQTCEALGRVSRDLRPVLRKQNAALRLMQEAVISINHWNDLISTI